MAEDAATPKPVENLSAVVVNHDAGDTLIGCVESLRRGGVVDIIVVDNASSDGSLVRLATVDRDVTLVPAGKNLGYGAAVNLGARRTSAEVLLVCNPDLLLDAEVPTRLLEFFAAHSDVAAIGPQVLDPSGARYPSARAFPDLLDAAGHAFFGLVHPDNPFTRRYREPSSITAASSEVDWVSGACMAIRRDAFDSIGGFDEGYFMYVEDLDLCWRLHRAGWKVAYLPDVSVTHIGGVSASRHPYAMLVAHHRSTWRFFQKSASGSRRALLPVVGAGLVARLGAAVSLEAKKSFTRAPGNTSESE